VSNRSALAAFATVALSALGLLGAPAAGAATRTRVTLQGRSALALPARLLTATPAGSQVQFSVGLKLRNRAGAIALEQAVSDPRSAQYRRFLSTAAWEQLFSPTQGAVRAVSSWLASEGITVLGVTPDRMTIHASASAAGVEHAFGVSLGEYRDGAHTLRLASSSLKVPSSLAALISGVVGVDQQVATHGALTNSRSAAGAGSGAARVARRSVHASGEEPIPPPPGTRDAPPCSGYYGEKKAASLPRFGSGYSSPLPWAVCGYVPAQLQGAYSLAGPIAAGVNGTGVTVAVIDAYASPTLQQDAEEYSRRHESSAVLSSSDFSEILPSKYTEGELCEASGWSVEQSLDVEAVHATAPGANILYVGGENCLNDGLFSALQKVVDGHLAQVISDSWADTAGELQLEPREAVSGSEREAFDNVLIMAGGIGIGVQFSAGDGGSNFTNVGINVPDYPSDSPYATSVGGTTLEVSKLNTRAAEYGWSSSGSVLCTPLLAELGEPGCTRQFNMWEPGAPGSFLYGGGGGTAYDYPEPEYQKGVVPAPLAARNAPITGEADRVEPDISADAAPETGMRIGFTQEFADGTYYDESTWGGTSLASPLLAGIMADVDQAAGGPLGFVNPLIYRLKAQSSPKSNAGVFYDELAAGRQALAFNLFADYEDDEFGTFTAANTIGFEGLEYYCSGTGECELQNVALHATPGFDSMTGVGSPGPEFLQALSATASAANARP